MHFSIYRWAAQIHMTCFYDVSYILPIIVPYAPRGVRGLGDTCHEIDHDALQQTVRRTSRDISLAIVASVT